MKRNVFTLLVFVFTSYCATAQTEMGNWLVGGSLELNTAKNNTTFQFSPNAGYFFANNFAAGAMLNMSYNKIVDTKVTSWGIGPFARYYFGTSEIKPLVHGQFGYLSSKVKSASESRTANGINYFLAGGLAGFINRNIALEGLAGYDHTKYRNNDGTGGFRFQVGFQVYLSKEQVTKAGQ